MRLKMCGYENILKYPLVAAARSPLTVTASIFYLLHSPSIAQPSARPNVRLMGDSPQGPITKPLLYQLSYASEFFYTLTREKFVPRRCNLARMTRDFL